jgi:hypothetical protein
MNERIIAMKKIIVFDNLRQRDFTIANKSKIIPVKALIEEKDLSELERVGKLAQETVDEFMEMFP